MPTTQNSKPLVRVTQIEAFRRYFYQSEHDNYEIPEQSVIDSITGAFQGNEMTRIGTAFHALVQTGCQPCSLAPAGSRSFTYYGKEKQEPVPEGRTFPVDAMRSRSTSHRSRSRSIIATATSTLFMRYGVSSTLALPSSLVAPT